ncbi:tellurium resistance protein TerD [Desulfotomaculum arcticum]|uniref:Tellurium resistance protein TerD n=1 Tax=Desulfotruncus arcticus DSM 17038 TaxID=1121424 RepID=A0A1I2PJN7_9FIRM|nr:TerD family protein [Desulfotruncus arcticus]SFG14197.1 tellurium resistance protein TerD [Desulfotomaculum arcticum] [Desulfotruncus arcticus DSM 17038]
MISLSKGQKIDLTKTNPGLTRIMVGLGWDLNKYDGGNEFDLDAVAFLVNKDGKATGDGAFIFYNNKQDPSGSIVLSGDNRTGEGAGDDETIKINLAGVPADVEKIAICINIHEADTRNQNFGQVANSFVRVVNDDNGEELLRYDLSEDYSIETGLVAAEIYRHNGEWKFSAVGSGFQGGLGALAASYGLSAG